MKQIRIKSIKTINNISTVFYILNGIQKQIELPSETTLAELIKILNLGVENNE